MSGEKMLKEIFNTYEILNKQIFIVNGFNNLTLIIKFNNNNFYHLVGFHKTNIGLFIPYYIKSQEKKYKYIKNNLDRFENILKNQIAEKDSLYFRIVQFPIYSHSKDLDVEKIGELLDCVGDYKLVKLFKLGDKLFLSIELLLDANQLTSNQIYGRVLNTLAEVSKHVEEILESHGK